MKTAKKVYSTYELMVRLALISAIAAVLLTVVNSLTQGPREEAQKAVVAEAIKRVLPAGVQAQGKAIYIDAADTARMAYEGDSSVSTMKDPVIFYPAFENGKLYGYAIESADANGYGGQIKVMFGMERDGILGITEVIAQNETPGLGTQETVRARQKTLSTLFDPADAGLAPNAYLDQFQNRQIVPSEVLWQVSTSLKPEMIPAPKNAETSINNVPNYQTAAKAGATVTMNAVNAAVFKGAHTFALMQKQLENMAEQAVKEGK